jgi:thioredoxin reductase (NADPH)
MTEELFDVIIIGGGPAGLSAGQYASRAALKTIILDKSSTAGALAYARRIENYPGLSEPLSGRQLLDIFRDQAKNFGAEYTETQVTGVKLDQEIKEVYALDKTYFGKTVIIATGAMGRKPNINGESEFLGKGVSYCAVCDAAFFKNQTVCVIGDSEEAVKETELLTQFANTVYLIAPSKTLRVSADHPAPSSDKVHVLFNHRIISIEGTDVVTHMRVKNTETGQEQKMPVDGVFVYLSGSQPVVDFLNSVTPMSPDTCITTDKMMETSLHGVFAAGDVTCVEVRQVIVAAASGCIAALSAEKYIRQRKRRKYDWSKKS